MPFNLKARVVLSDLKGYGLFSFNVKARLFYASLLFNVNYATLFFYLKASSFNWKLFILFYFLLLNPFETNHVSKRLVSVLRIGPSFDSIIVSLAIMAIQVADSMHDQGIILR